jgi:hypothetical protein
LTYEFSDIEAEKIWVFGNKLVISSLIMLVAGVLGIFFTIARFNQLEQMRAVVYITEFLFLIAIAVLLFRPSDNFKMIATSEGRDMDELMKGLNEFKLAFVMTTLLILTIGIFQFVLLLEKV